MKGDLPMMAALSAAEAHMAAGNYAEATQKYLQLAETGSMHPAEKAIILDAMASIPVVHGDKRFLAQAEHWAKQAHALLPDCKTLRGTLGSILVEKGSCAEGMALLMPLTSEDNPAVDRVLASCYVAKALHALGDAVQAGAWMETARRAGVFPQVCSRIASELGRA
jgi:predicted Zn-dependent protease